MKSDLSMLSHEQLSLLHALIKNHKSVHQGNSGEQLLAYYTRPEQQPEQNHGAELRSIAQTLLPGHMVPDMFVPVEEIPRLANGKVDLHRLPYVVITRSQSADSTTGSTQPEFDVVARVLGELLGFDDIRPSDNFFELGGDSITAIRLVSRVREAGVPIEIKAVTSPLTLGEIAAEASQRPHQADGDSSLTNAASERETTVGKTPNLDDGSSFDAVDHPDLGLNQNELDSFLDSLD